jgi:hypothetical protein
VVALDGLERFPGSVDAYRVDGGGGVIGAVGVGCACGSLLEVSLVVSELLGS